jgi:hypothetical protein
MLLLAAAAIIASGTPQTDARNGASVQAIASVRVIRGIRVRFGEEQGGDVPQARETFVRSGDSQEPAKLIEFQ